ncbi:5529_t:CDS:1, partial [Funneliformis geosporum]
EISSSRNFPAVPSSFRNFPAISSSFRNFSAVLRKKYYTYSSIFDMKYLE